MSSVTPKRTRSDRVAAFSTQPGAISRSLRPLRRVDVLIRVGICLAAALIMWAVTGAWEPFFSFRTGHIPPRDIVARVAFQQPNEQETSIRKSQAHREAICIYQHDVRPIVDSAKV